MSANQLRSLTRKDRVAKKVNRDAQREAETLFFRIVFGTTSISLLLLLSEGSGRSQQRTGG